MKRGEAERNKTRDPGATVTELAAGPWIPGPALVLSRSLARDKRDALTAKVPS
jgi:hypothetical protein